MIVSPTGIGREKKKESHAEGMFWLVWDEVLAEMSVKELFVWEFCYVNPWMNVLKVYYFSVFKCKYNKKTSNMVAVCY